MTRKTENSGKTAKRRKTGGRDFKKGAPSPNPNGRPKKEFDLVTRCRELTGPIIEHYGKLGRSARTSAAVAAGKVVIEYGHDRPRQRTELTGKDGAPIFAPEAKMTRTEMQREIERLEALEAAGGDPGEADPPSED